MKKTFFRRSLLITSIGFVFSTPALAAITVDGKLDPLSEWDNTFSVGFQFDNGTTGTGFLALGTQDNGSQVLYYTVPKQFVDISFGDTSIGWGSHEHKYKELKGSDKLEFETKAGDYVKIELKGVVKEGGSIIETAATSLQYDAALAGVNVGSKNHGLDSPTIVSGDYNDDSNANYVVDTNDSNNAGLHDWIFDVAYEIEFKDGIFNTTDWANGDLDKLFSTESYGQHHGPALNFFFGGHASPSKTFVTAGTPPTVTPCGDPNSNPGQDPNCGPGDPGNPGNPVPVPGTIWLMLAGLIGFYKTRIKS